MKYLGNLFATAVIASSVAFAQLQPCNLAQLAGDEDLFTITGGNGIFDVNSTQSILYDRPPGAPVRRIRANVTIVDLDTNESFEPSEVTGAPVEFLANETSTQMNGVIDVTLPGDIPESENYVFRVTLRSRGSLCYLDTSNFTIAGDIIETCTPGAMICTDDFTGFQQCVETAVNATEFAYGDVIDCAATTVCSPVNSTVIQCAAPPVIDECTLGDAECVGDSSRVCILDEMTGGTIWTDPVPCLEGFSCDSETGLCAMDPPVDECIIGDAECVTPTSNRVCVIDPATNTTVWSSPQECPAGTTCTNGICSSSNPGEGCVPMSQVCLSTTTFDTCNHSENGVWFLGGITSNCPEDTECEPYMDNAGITSINCVPVNGTETVMTKRSLFRFKRE